MRNTCHGVDRNHVRSIFRDPTIQEIQWPKGPHQEGTENPPRAARYLLVGGPVRKTLVPDEPYQVDDHHFKKVPNNKQQMRKSTVDIIHSRARLKVSRGPFLQSIVFPRLRAACSTCGTSGYKRIDI